MVRQLFIVRVRSYCKYFRWSDAVTKDAIDHSRGWREVCTKRGWVTQPATEVITILPEVQSDSPGVNEH